MRPIITLLTDFGSSDAYVGTMKGVILSICPQAQLVDLTHAIEPQNVRQAAYVLLTAFRHFPPQTIFLVVVDPGVGTEREPIAVQTNYGIYVAPNNGVLSYLIPHIQVEHVVILQNADYRLPGVSATFHGRDIFAPAAAHLANSVPITEFGPAVPEFYQLNSPVLEIGESQIRGEVLHVDHFGNIITSIGHLIWAAPGLLELNPQFGTSSPEPLTLNAALSQVTVASKVLQGILPTYGAMPPGSLLALVGSSGQLEIGINQGNAAQVLGVTTGDAILLDFETTLLES